MEQQLTFACRHHQLTNINIWTADSQWIVFDTRSQTAIFDGQSVERVSLEGDIDVLYRARRGASLGVVTVSPELPPRYVCIEGPEYPDATWCYDFHHRHGLIIAPQQTGTLDAFDITSPYTPGALRGGSHVHVFSPDGTRLSFTYNDHVMYQSGLDRRNVGVAVPLHPVFPPLKHPREYPGSHFCVLVSETSANPLPGSDEIDRAYEEGWIGLNGYKRNDGSHQRWALAFIGDTRNISGEKIPEIFIVDLPEALSDYAIPGKIPLQGTGDHFPAPPAGVKQRRLTFTHQRLYPGIATVPRHWLRSSPDGSKIAFLMKDDRGIVQLWLQPVTGGGPQQISFVDSDIQSALSWHPSGMAVALIQDNSVMLCDVGSGRMQRLTSPTTPPPIADAVVCSPDGHYIAYLRLVDGWQQIFVVQI
ncbi:MAG: Protein TolB [Candidatus Erwinia impunctatus]|nr:Protein TolB [Culicoides impunctatus]